MVSVECAQCGKELPPPSPSKLARNAHHFCSPQCSRIFQQKRVQVVCGWCGKEMLLMPSRVNASEKNYCCLDHAWRAKTHKQSTYWHRNLEASPRQKVVRFLVMHSIGQSGFPGENVILLAKSGFFTPGISPHSEPIEVLAMNLQELGHYKLAAMVLDGSWENEDEWLCFSANWYHRTPKKLPWEE